MSATSGPNKKVSKFSEAFLWDCSECGHRNFEAPRTAGSLTRYQKRLVMAVHQGLPDPDMISLDDEEIDNYEIIMPPAEVKCRKCGELFESDVFEFSNAANPDRN
jgi:DNA-directed RNA polymerase subunit RPC12/RpoP